MTDSSFERSVDEAKKPMDYYSSVEALPINQSLASIGGTEKSVQPLPSKKLNDELA